MKVNAKDALSGDYGVGKKALFANAFTGIPVSYTDVLDAIRRSPEHVIVREISSDAFGLQYHEIEKEAKAHGKLLLYMPNDTVRKQPEVKTFLNDAKSAATAATYAKAYAEAIEAGSSDVDAAKAAKKAANDVTIAKIPIPDELALAMICKVVREGKIHLYEAPEEDIVRYTRLNNMMEQLREIGYRLRTEKWNSPEAISYNDKLLHPSAITNVDVLTALCDETGGKKVKRYEYHFFATCCAVAAEIAISGNTTRNQAFDDYEWLCSLYGACWGSWVSSAGYHFRLPCLVAKTPKAATGKYTGVTKGIKWREDTQALILKYWQTVLRKASRMIFNHMWRNRQADTSLLQADSSLDFANPVCPD